MRAWKETQPAPVSTSRVMALAHTIIARKRELAQEHQVKANRNTLRMRLPGVRQGAQASQAPRRNAISPSSLFFPRLSTETANSPRSADSRVTMEIELDISPQNPATPATPRTPTSSRSNWGRSTPTPCLTRTMSRFAWAHVHCSTKRRRYG